MLDSVDSPVVHETGIANWSPADENRQSANLVVHHFSNSEQAGWVRSRVAVDDEPHHDFVRLECYFIWRNEFGSVDRFYGISWDAFTFVETEVDFCIDLSNFRIWIDLSETIDVEVFSQR